VTRPYPGNAHGARARLSGVLRGRARRDRHGALQPHRLVSGARAARRGGLGAPRRSGAHRLESGEPAPIPPYPDFAAHRWELGAGYGVYNRSKSGLRLPRLRAHRQPRRGGSRCSRPSARSTTATSRRSACAHLHARMEMVFADRGHRHGLPANRDNVPPAPLESTTNWPTRRSARAASSRGGSCGASIGEPLRVFNSSIRARIGRMEIRLSSVLLAALLLSGCGWFHRGDKGPAPSPPMNRSPSLRSSNRRSRAASSRRRRSRRRTSSSARITARSASRTSAPIRSTACAAPTT
jgi:hypothetical protein